jgi:ribosomal protein L37E
VEAATADSARSTGSGLGAVLGAESKGSRASAPQGHCLRCGTTIPFDTIKPYCLPHFMEWAEWENEDYEDPHCHKCGKPRTATMRRPLCQSCYRRS